MEKSTDELVPVFHSDASGTDSAEHEYEYVSGTKIKIELMLDTTKPVLSNDIARDFNITAVNILIGEGVKSWRLPTDSREPSNRYFGDIW